MARSEPAGDTATEAVSTCREVAAPTGREPPALDCDGPRCLPALLWTTWGPGLGLRGFSLKAAERWRFCHGAEVRAAERTRIWLQACPSVEPSGTSRWTEAASDVSLTLTPTSSRGRPPWARSALTRYLVPIRLCPG